MTIAARCRKSTTTSLQQSVEPAVLPPESEQLPDLPGYLKLASTPEWSRAQSNSVSPSASRHRQPRTALTLTSGVSRCVTTSRQKLKISMSEYLRSQPCWGPYWIPGGSKHSKATSCSSSGLMRALDSKRDCPQPCRSGTDSLRVACERRLCSGARQRP